MSTNSTATAPQTPDKQEEDVSWQSLIFFKKLDKDIWEAWVWAAVGLFVATVLIWGLAFLRLGPQSIKAYVLIPWTGIMALPFVVWGLIRSLLNPPIFRLSRTIGFLTLTIVGVGANTPLFPAPLSTESWISKATYTLPVKGQWYTIAGGPEMSRNVLSTSPSMRYGTIMTIVKDGKRHKNNGKELTDHYCYGQPVYAPADGEVLQSESKIKDHLPNTESKKGYRGNYVVMKLSSDVYFFMFGLKKGSNKLKQGQKIKAGQKIGECGNSGATKQPQIQFHFQNSVSFPLSEGLPVRFNYRVGKSLHESKMPLGATQDKLLTSGQMVEAF